MGNGQPRHPFKGRPPKVLEGLDIPALAKYIASERCKNIVLMLGAGVSTSAGIPDFRSPKTGLYSNLARLNLPNPEAVFEINFFRSNPVPFYTLAHELYPGKFRPTPTHAFIRLLAAHSLLHTCFTQNIDTLERRAGVPGHKIIEAHGSFASQRCIDCRAPYDDARMRRHVRAREIATCDRCGGFVKPDIVFFGEALPDQFINAIPGMADADLLIVIGTSLTVHPFASLAGMVRASCPRVLINLDRVGNFGSRPDDVVLLGMCDDIVKELCKELGWHDELMELWLETELTTDEEAEAAEAAEEAAGVDKEVENLAAAIGERLDMKEVTTQISKKQANPEDSERPLTPTSASPSPPPLRVKAETDVNSVSTPTSGVNQTTVNSSHSEVEKSVAPNVDGKL